MARRAWSLCPCGNRTGPGFSKGPTALNFNAFVHQARASYITPNAPNRVYLLV
jgi:hypothetical protein